MTDSATSFPMITLPDSLKPRDGRFGCGPSTVRPEALARLTDPHRSVMGTSHRQKPVRNLVGELRAGLRELFSLPEGYEVVLGNGGTTAFWDIATLNLIHQRSQHLAFGEFSSKFATAAKAAPFLEDPSVISAPVGRHPLPHAEPGIDAYALTHNETSTGVAMPIGRVAGADPEALVLVDATSGAGALPVEPTEFDAYYFAPQKVFASDGGLWFTLLSPAALERVARIAGSGRWIPAFLDLTTAIDNSRKQQTLNTPALATLTLMNEQVQWLLGNGGLEWSIARSAQSARTIYGWAEQSEFATPFVADPAQRSAVVATIDFAERLDAAAVAATLRANGILDTEPYRKLGRNQLRVALFPAIDPADVAALTGCIDYIVERLG